MQTALAVLLLSCLPLQDKPSAPDPARVKAAVTELEKAFRGTAKEDKLKAIQTSSDVLDAEVAKAIGKGLEDKEMDVQRSAIEALRWMQHPDALKELQSAARTKKEMRKEPVLYAALLKAVGQHASPSSLDILKDDVWSVPEHGVVQARILGLGQIRTREAVDALMDLMKVAGPQRIQNVMPDFRLALVQLTGVDKGQSQQMWQDWWNDNKGKLKVSEKPGELPRELQFKWDAYWGKQDMYERLRKRSERGQGDPEKGGSKGQNG